MKKYRIVEGVGNRCTVEIKRWWWPFWCDITPYLVGFENRDAARTFVIAHSRAFVVEEIEA